MESKYDTKEPIYKTETVSHVIVKEKGTWKRTDWEFGISRYRLLYREWIKKVLLYSTGNSIQHPVTNQNGKECEKGYIYV